MKIWGWMLAHAVVALFMICLATQPCWGVGVAMGAGVATETGIMAQAGMGTELAVSNNFIATAEGMKMERQLYQALLSYMVLTVLGSSNDDSDKVLKWKRALQVLPTFEMWDKSMKTSDPRRYDVCSDWDREAYETLVRSKNRIHEQEKTTLLRTCFQTMKNEVGEDASAAMLGGQSDRIKALIPYAAIATKLFAGYSAMMLGVEVMTSRLTMSASDEALSIASTENGFVNAQTQNSFTRMPWLDTVLQPGAYAAIHLPLIGYPSYHFLLDLLSRDVEPVRRATARRCGLDLEDVWVFNERQEVIHIDEGDTLNREVKLLVLAQFPECQLGYSSNDACRSRADACRSAVVTMASETVSAINAEYRGAGLVAAERIGSDGVVHVHPEPVKALGHPSLVVVEVDTSLQTTPSRGKYQCGVLGAISYTHSSSYDHVAVDAPCVAGTHFGAICEVRCRPGYMTGNRWGRYAMCGYDDSKEGDSHLKWLPAGIAYQEMCAPDPIQRRMGLAVRFSAEVPLWETMTSTDGLRVAGWRNLVRSPITRASCKPPCSDMLGNVPADNTLITRYGSQLGWPLISWSGTAPAVTLGGLDVIHLLWGRDPGYRYYDTGRPDRYGRFTTQLNRAALAADGRHSHKQHVEEAIKLGVTVVVAANLSDPDELGRLQSIISIPSMLSDAAYAPSESNGMLHQVVSEAYLRGGPVILTARANCTELPVAQETFHKCKCASPCATHKAQPHELRPIASLLRSDGTPVRLARDPASSESNPTWTYCFTKPGCSYQLDAQRVEDSGKGFVKEQHFWDACLVQVAEASTQIRVGLSVRINGVELHANHRLKNSVGESDIAASSVTSCASFAKSIGFAEVLQGVSYNGSTYYNSSDHDNNLPTDSNGLNRFGVGSGCHAMSDGSCNLTNLKGDISDFALYTRFLGLRHVESIELFLAQKWRMMNRLAPAAPAVPGPVACNEVVLGRIYTCQIKFPTQGKLFYEPHNEIKLRACFCQDTAPAQNSMQPKTCAMSATCSDVLSGAESHTFPSISISSTSSHALRFMLMSRTGQDVQEARLATTQMDRPPWQDCQNTQTDLGCWVTGPLTRAIFPHLQNHTTT